MLKHKKMIKFFLIVILNLFLLTSCKSQKPKNQLELQEEIIEKYLTNQASKYRLCSRERDEEIDKGLKIDSTIAYLWQQKAMPLFKQGKYEIGMDYLNKAVKYDTNRWQDYRAFIKCIFAKTYYDAIIDFESCKKRMGNSYVMDHSYDFYISLSYLQLNKFKKAEEILNNDIKSLRTTKGDDWVHHLDLFYFGITKLEQKKYKEAIEVFDSALKKYPQFSDAQYYKTICLKALGHKDQAELLLKSAKINAKKGYTINEDNVIYERYPYQVKW